MILKLRITLIALAVVTLAVYWQVSGHGFINLDDQAYVYENSHVTSGLTTNNIIWAFTSVDYFYWHPVTWLSHMLDVEFYGMNPGGHHLTNVYIHIASSLLLLTFLFRLTGQLWQSAFVAAMFALHPMHVESVAWVAERKDVLSAFFGLLTLLFYVEYKSFSQTSIAGRSLFSMFAGKDRSAPPPSNGEGFGRGNLKFYLLSLICFMLGLMSKPMLVTLPVIMLLIDYWILSTPRMSYPVRGRIVFIIDKIPFLILSIASTIITIYGHNKMGAMPNLQTVPIFLRIENSIIAYLKYILITLVPHDLAVYYPMPPSFILWEVVGSLLTLLIVSVVVICFRGKFPYLLVGWFWFLITLLPVIGLTQAGISSMADRFSYIPHVGFFIMFAWGATDLTRRLKQQKMILALLAGVVIVALSAATWQQLSYWENSIVLLEHAVDVTENNWLALNNLGQAYLNVGRVDDALWCFDASVQAKPSYVVALVNLGALLAAKNRSEEAVVVLKRALQFEPGNYKATLILQSLQTQAR